MSLKPNWTTQGRTLTEALNTAACLASVNARAPIGPRYPEPFAVAWTFALAPDLNGACRQRPACAAPHPNLALTGQRRRVEPALCIGRYEGTDNFLGRRAFTDSSLHSSLGRREHLNMCVVQPRSVCAVIRKSRQNTRLSAGNARNPKAEKNAKKPLSGVVCLLTRRGLIWVRPGRTVRLSPHEFLAYLRPWGVPSPFLGHRCHDKWFDAFGSLLRGSCSGVSPLKVA